MTTAETYHYYTAVSGKMQRITKAEADRITAENNALPFDRWDEIRFIVRVPAENADELRTEKPERN